MNIHESISGTIFVGIHVLFFIGLSIWASNSDSLTNILKTFF
jgi:hypothetical protein